MSDVTISPRGDAEGVVNMRRSGACEGVCRLKVSAQLHSAAYGLRAGSTSGPFPTAPVGRQLPRRARFTRANNSILRSEGTTQT
jgi:hypothetical protein